MIDLENFITSNFTLFIIILVFISLIPLIVKIFVLVKLTQIAKNSRIIKQEMQRLNSSSSQNLIQKQEEYL